MKTNLVNMKIRKLYVDQWGNHFYADTVKELKEEVGAGKVRIMYRDKKDGSTVRCGYIIGQHWLEAYMPFEQKI